MKKRINIITLSSLTLIILSLLFVKCKEIQDPTDDLKLIVNYNIIKSSLSVTFMDAASGDSPLTNILKNGFLATITRRRRISG